MSGLRLVVGGSLSTLETSSAPVLTAVPTPDHIPKDETETALGRFLADACERGLFSIHEIQVLWAGLDNPQRWSEDRLERISEVVDTLVGNSPIELVTFLRDHLIAMSHRSFLETPLNTFSATLDRYFSEEGLDLDETRVLILQAVFVAFVVTP